MSTMAPAFALLLRSFMHGTWVLACTSSENTAPAGGGGGGAGAAGSGQACWMLPVQAAMSSWVPLVVLAHGSSRHRPDAWLTRVFPAPGCHCWLAAPVQVLSAAGVPWPVPPPWVSRHRPLIWIVVSGATVQFCSASFRQVES